jgi:hypothetical protein
MALSEVAAPLDIDLVPCRALEREESRGLWRSLVVGQSALIACVDWIVHNAEAICRTALTSLKTAANVVGHLSNRRRDRGYGFRSPAMHI